MDPWWGSRKRPWNGVAANTATDTSTNLAGLTGTFVGSDPTWTYSGWRPQIKFTHISDGLSHTLLIGEKYVHPNTEGKIWEGDGSFWSDDGMVGKVRVAGVRAPLARSDYDETVVPDALNMPFGGSHPGICQFVWCDGRVQPLATVINTKLLGYLANRSDSKVVDSGAY